MYIYNAYRVSSSSSSSSSSSRIIINSVIIIYIIIDTVNIVSWGFDPSRPLFVRGEPLTQDSFCYSATGRARTMN